MAIEICRLEDCFHERWISRIQRFGLGRCGSGRSHRSHARSYKREVRRASAHCQSERNKQFAQNADVHADADAYPNADADPYAHADADADFVIDIAHDLPTADVDPLRIQCELRIDPLLGHGRGSAQHGAR